nr:hypothetical protein CFP56_29411 [Quercus suber]
MKVERLRPLKCSCSAYDMMHDKDLNLRGKLGEGNTMIEACGMFLEDGKPAILPKVEKRRPRLKKKYQRRAERVKEYLESVKDFDELVSPQSLFLHFLGSKLSIKVRKNLEVVKKTMTSRFSKQKLAEAQEKKAKGGTISGLLSKKKTGDAFKKDSMTTLPLANSPAKRPASPTSSLEVIASGGEEVHEALSMDNLSPLMAKSSRESLLVSRRLLDLEKKVATFEPLVKFLFVENETLKNKVAILIAEVENVKECVATLEKSLLVEKDFCKMKDKQIGDLQLKFQIVGATAAQDFRNSDKYFDELCKYYVKDFDLFVKCMAKHHLGLDLFGLAMDDIKKELMSDRPFEATAENAMERATDVAEVMEEATITTPVDPVPDKQ